MRRIIDPRQCELFSQKAYKDTVAHVGDLSAVDRQVVTAVKGKMLDKYGVDTVRNMLERNAHQRTLKVVERQGTRVVKFQRASNIVADRQDRVRASQEIACMSAHRVHEATKELLRLAELMLQTTGKDRRNIRSRIRTIKRLLKEN